MGEKKKKKKKSGSSVWKNTPLKGKKPKTRKNHFPACADLRLKGPGELFQSIHQLRARARALTAAARRRQQGSGTRAIPAAAA